MLAIAAFATLGASGCSHNKDTSGATTPTTTMPEADAAPAEPGSAEPDSAEPGTSKAAPTSPGLDDSTNRSNTSEKIYPSDAGPDLRQTPEPTAPVEDTPVPHVGPPGNGTQPPPTP